MIMDEIDYLVVEEVNTMYVYICSYNLIYNRASFLCLSYCII